MNDFIAEQNRLQKQALEITKELCLDNILNKYGNYNLVGSVVYGLMTWRDVDIDLATQNDPTDSEYWSIVKSIFAIPSVKLLSLSDNRHQVDLERPKSMYIGIKYEDINRNIWKIDIRLLSERSITTDKIAELIKNNIHDELRIIILQIKSQVHNIPKYHKEFSSVDIY